VRDLANTPLQTVELSVAMLRRQAPHLGSIIDRIERALDRLRLLSTTLSQYEEGHPSPATAASLDSPAIVKRRVRS
jgi:hypothetical protein